MQVLQPVRPRVQNEHTVAWLSVTAYFPHYTRTSCADDKIRFSNKIVFSTDVLVTKICRSILIKCILKVETFEQIQHFSSLFSFLF